MKKVGYILLTIILLVPMCAKALELEDLNSKIVLIYNKDEDKILYEKNAEEITSIASLTKIMTTLISIEMIEDLKEEITITSKMLANVRYDASVAGLEVGDKITYEDLLYASMLPSGADATDSLAISLTGSIKSFVEKMNSKAKELKLDHTSFSNTTGLDAEGHYSTAKDILTLLNYALENKTFKKIFETKSYIASNGLKLESTISKYNRTLGYNLSFIKGGKTGLTDKAGQCLAALSEIDNTNIITITIGAPVSYEKPSNIVDINTLYGEIKEDYSKVNLIEENQVLKTLETKYAKEKNVKIKSTEDISRFIEEPYNEDYVKIEYSGEKVIASTTKKGTELGKFKIYYKDELIEELPAILSTALHFSVWAYLKENILYYALLLIIIIGTLKILKKPKKRRKKRA